MAKLTCPTCSAVNQDVEPSDPCWKCNKLLNIAPETRQTAEAAPQFVAPSEKVEGFTTQPAKLPNQPIQITKPEPIPAGSTPNRALVIGVLVVVAIVIIVAAFLIKGH